MEALISLSNINKNSFQFLLVFLKNIVSGTHSKLRYLGGLPDWRQEFCARSYRQLTNNKTYRSLNHILRCDDAPMPQPFHWFQK